MSLFNDEDDLERPDPASQPIYQKGLELFDLAYTIAGLIDEEDPVLSSLKGFIVEDAALLGAKISGAIAVDLYDLKMENATIIRKAARDLGTHCTSLEMFGFPETHYLNLIRITLEEFRLLFVEWVKTFDPWNYVYDTWGLFNPPGVTRPEEDF